MESRENSLVCLRFFPSTNGWIPFLQFILLWNGTRISSLDGNPATSDQRQLGYPLLSALVCSASDVMLVLPLFQISLLFLFNTCVQLHSPFPHVARLAHSFKSLFERACVRLSTGHPILSFESKHLLVICF